MKLSLVSMFTITVLEILFHNVVTGNTLLVKDRLATEELRNLGSVDDKSYYLSEENRLTWMDAHWYSFRNEMHLATIKTRSQTYFLRTAADNLTYHHSYWTPGKHSLQAPQFRWGYSQEALDDNFIWPFGSDIALTCLYFTPILQRYVGVNCALSNPIL